MNRVSILQLLAVRVSPQLPDWEKLIANEGNDRPVLVTFINPRCVFVGRRDHSYIAELDRFDWVLVDGMLMAWAASLLRHVPIKRASFDGRSIGRTILDILASQSKAVALVGGEEGIASKAGRILGTTLGVNVTVAVSGYFTGEEDRQAAIAKIIVSGARDVICGMGVPLQERFLLELCAAGWCGVAWTCGGYLSQIAERGINYYPKWVSKLNLRAFYRMFREPGRMIWRYGIEYLDFFLSLPMLLLPRWRKGSEMTPLQSSSRNDTTR